MTEAKVALITAGGSGLGAHVARRLHEEDGYRIGILSSSGNGEELAKTLGGVGVTGSNLNVDDLARLVDATLKKWGRIDAVINSAGHGPKGDLLEISDDEYHQAMDVYLLNVIRMARLVMPTMVAQGGGTIVNISAFAAVEPDPVFPTSGMFRAALANFTKLFADRYAADNLRMNNVLPGFIDSLPENKERRDRVPMGRYGTTQEVSSLLRYLVSDDAGYITGQNIRIDGGLVKAV